MPDADLPLRACGAASISEAMQVAILDPSLFTLPFDIHFARALAAEGAGTMLIGRPLRGYEEIVEEGFAFHPLFYRWSEGGEDWRSSGWRRGLKGVEHLFGHFALARLLGREGVRILHVQWLMLPLLDLPFLRRMRRHAGLFLTVHNAELTAHSLGALVGPLGAIVQAAGRGRLLDLFDGFVVHTEKTRATIAALGIEEARIRLLPHPPLEVGKDEGGAAEEDPEGRVEILFFGTIKPYKGVDLLIEAGLRLAGRRRDFRIRIAGRPFLDLAPLRARIAAAGAEDCFAFELGYLPDERLSALLARADLVVFPYREIDGSGALALAASHGRPILASRVGVFAEAPVADRIHLVPPDDVETLSRALEHLIAVPEARAALAASCRDLASHLGDWRGYARACLEFYRAGTGDRIRFS